MRALSDKAIQFRTFPVIPRKRVKFDQNETVNFTEFNSKNILFQCEGGFFTHNSYRLLDYFTSYWFEVVCINWTKNFGGKFPDKITKENIDNVMAMTPISTSTDNGLLQLTDGRIELFQRLKNYTLIEEISDIEMRRHPSLKGITSSGLNEIISRTSQVKLKTIYQIRSIKENKKRKYFGWITFSNLSDQAPWWSLFDYRLLDERKGKDGRVIERIYKFGFNSSLSLGMIHNTICGGTWGMNPNFYKVSGDAQLLYRYLVITGSRRKNNRVDYIGHRIGWREKQKKRLVDRIGWLFTELQEANLILSFEISGNKYRGYLISFEFSKRSTVKKEGKLSN
jgi:hypothetical protein